MSPVSANSLLKILEDPPGNSLMLLTTSKLNSLPPTISGRCQTLRFSELSPEELKLYISDRYQSLNIGEIEFYSKMAEGSISKLSKIIDSDYMEIRDLIIEILRSLVVNKNIKLQNEIRTILEGKSKERIKQFFQLIQIWFRDVIYLTNNNKNKIINSDKLDVLEKFQNNISSDNYRIIKLIENSVEMLNMNIYPESVINNTMMSIKELLKLK